MTKTVPPSNTVSAGRNKASVRSSRKWKLVSQWEKEETDFEKYLRIKESNEAKEKKKSIAAIKKLKKEGKVQPISGFLVYKEEEDDDWMRSKKDRFRNNRKIRNKKALKPPSPAATNKWDSNDSDDNDDFLEEILNFCPFRNALNKPIVRKCQRKKSHV